MSSQNKRNNHSDRDGNSLDQALGAFAEHPLWFGNNTLLNILDEDRHANNKNQKNSVSG